MSDCSRFDHFGGARTLRAASTLECWTSGEIDHRAEWLVLLCGRTLGLWDSTAVDRRRTWLRQRSSVVDSAHPGYRVKSDRRDATNLAKLHRAGELTACCAMAVTTIGRRGR
jgi:hypothetical protein